MEPEKQIGVAVEPTQTAKFKQKAEQLTWALVSQKTQTHAHKTFVL